MKTNASQTLIWNSLRVPPNKADIRVSGPLKNTETVQKNLFEIGLSASDLEPLDWRNGSISETRNQWSCGDCWAMSSTSALQDRFMVQKGIKSLKLQPTILAQCCANPNGQINQGCGGGQPYLAGQFFEQNGISEIVDNCPSWNSICSQNSCNLPTCQQIEQVCNGMIYKAIAGSTNNLSVVNGTTVDKATTIINIKKELVNGPVVACFFVPKDFIASSGGYNWDLTNGIFINGAYNDYFDKNASSTLRQALGNPVGKQWQDIMMEDGSPAGHAVEIVGWDIGNAGGSYGKVSYWIVRNSWGTDWGDNGYFKIAMNDSDANYNQYLGFDIPVSQLYIVSTGSATNIGGIFGGVTSFEPDLNSGKAGNGPQTVPTKSEKMRKNLLIVIVLLIILLIMFFLYLRYRRKF